MTNGKIDFAELSNDTNFVNKVTNIVGALDKIEEAIEQALALKDYEGLSVQEKVKYDLFLSYSINSLYWMYVKLQGLDPNTHDIKHELSRVRQAMTRDKEIYERNTIRPVLDREAAGRFVRHGLKLKRKAVEVEDEESEDDDIECHENPCTVDPAPKNKHIRFDD